jgi:glycosyltransferase 2 family protein
MRHSRTRVWTLIGLVLSVGLLVGAFWKVDFGELWEIVTRADPGMLAGVVILNFVFIGLKSLRWREIIATTHRVRWVEVATASLIGFMASSIVPVRGGEVVRVLVLGRRTGMSRTTLAGALAVDHIVEGAGMVLIMLGLPFFLPTPPWMRTTTTVVAGVTLGAAVLGWLLLGARRAELTERLPPAWRLRVASVAGKLGDGLATLTNAPRLAYVLALALGMWLFQGILLALCLRATGLSLGFHQVMFVLMVINVGALIPGAPSSVGPFEFAAVMALGSLGISKTPALTTGLLYHFVQVIPTIVAGLVALPLAGLRLRDLGGSASAQSASSKSA